LGVARVVLRLVLPCALAAALAGCGGGSKTDAGGFTASDFRGAQKALDALAQTSVYDAALDITQTAAEDPTACVVHVESRDPLLFRVLLTWKPNTANLGGSVEQGAGGRTFSWIVAVIGPNGIHGEYSFHQGNELTNAALKAHYGDAFSKPLEKCLLLQNQAFGLLPSS
jgi:hypothetical protein